MRSWKPHRNACRPLTSVQFCPAGSAQFTGAPYTVAMSLRYAHLAPDQRREAVAKLNEKPLLALTMRLQWDGFPAGSHYRIDSMVEREGLEPSTPAL